MNSGEHFKKSFTTINYYYQESRIRINTEYFSSHFFCQNVRFPVFYCLWKLCSGICSSGKEPFVMSQSAPLKFQNTGPFTSLSVFLPVCVIHTHLCMYVCTHAHTHVWRRVRVFSMVFIRASALGGLLFGLRGAVQAPRPSQRGRENRLHLISHGGGF